MHPGRSWASQGGSRPGDSQLRRLCPGRSQLQNQTTRLNPVFLQPTPNAGGRWGVGGCPFYLGNALPVPASIPHSRGRSFGPSLAPSSGRNAVSVPQTECHHPGNKDTRGGKSLSPPVSLWNTEWCFNLTPELASRRCRPPPGLARESGHEHACPPGSSAVLSRL